MIGVTPGFEATALRLCRSLADSGPVSVSDFDDDWTPTGEAYRDELLTGGLVEISKPPAEEDGPPMISLTGAGVALALGQAPVEPADTPQP